MCSRNPRATAWPVAAAVGAAVVLALLTGCASGGGSGAAPASGPLDRALEFVGLRKPVVPEAVAVAKELVPLRRRVALRLHAGEVLNTDAAGRSLPVVARVYKLRGAAAFQQLPHEAFLAAVPERGSALAQDVVEVRELVLAPGQRHEVVETLPAEATHLAVVALFRAPAPQRWRFVFEAQAAATSGVTLGVHGCALSVAEGQALDALPENTRLAGVRCRAT